MNEKKSTPIAFQSKSFLEFRMGDQSPESIFESEAMAGLQLNLRSLEFLLRVSLRTDAISEIDLTGYKVGDTLPLTAVTDYASLGDLVRRHNLRVSEPNKWLRIDSRLVELRDALAHGRYVGTQDGEKWYLVKFSKPVKRADTVAVTFHQELTEEWLSLQAGYVLDAIQKISSAMQHQVEARRLGLDDRL
jgi:hypothetical protein